MQLNLAIRRPVRAPLLAAATPWAPASRLEVFA
jgi:hypothetical protein